MYTKTDKILSKRGKQTTHKKMQKLPQKYTKYTQKMQNCHKKFTVSVINVRNSHWSVCCGGYHGNM